MKFSSSKKTLAIKILLFLLALTTVVGFTTAVHAQAQYTLLQPLPGVTSSDSGATDFPTYLKGFFSLLIGLALILAVLIIIFGGIQYMSTDAITGKKSGRERITQALLGLLIILGAFLLLQTINPDLVNFSLTPPATNTSFTGSGGAGGSFDNGDSSGNTGDTGGQVPNTGCTPNTPC
jgi:Type IV secretion system pilin